MNDSTKANVAQPSLAGGVAFNASWNQVFALQVVDHNRQPPNPSYVGFGDPGGAIGRVVSISSNFPASRPQPYASDRQGLRILVAIPIGLIATLVFQIVNKTITGNIRYNSANYKALSPFYPVMQGAVFVAGAAVVMGTYILAGKLFKKTAAGPEYTCTMIGELGAFVVKRGPERDECTFIPFDGVFVRNRTTRETTVIKDQFGNKRGQSTELSVTSDWWNQAGELVYHFHWNGMEGREPRQQIDFVEAAETAQLHYRLGQLVPQLDREGVRFPLEGTPYFLHLYRNRIDVSIGGQGYSVSPSDIPTVRVDDDSIVLQHRQAPISLPKDKIANLRLLLTLLDLIGIRTSR